ncbi:hypothetical protein COO91_01814 [Nostoc flagelliforme CCNUN1]|uniref:Uncharacterized protein n=1 Tax=Nostoc flagelliforme CCNUN1 TaxID=2038116 RepID=A0A2K8SKF3_9NOSO|nr:hypothetical protein [Nostoc flagelliforme]AUB35921.1 hypothetical protein COO91_01814 [Nostoc flagelliforme CCNUN1]
MEPYFVELGIAIAQSHNFSSHVNYPERSHLNYFWPQTRYRYFYPLLMMSNRSIIRGKLLSDKPQIA